MKRFNFSMQYLSDFRTAKKQRAELALMAAMKAVSEAEYVLQFLIGRRENLVRDIEEIQGLIQRTIWSEKMRYLQEFDRRITERRRELYRLKENVRLCRKALKDEMKECRILENIEKSERMRWNEEMQHEEQKQMDEIAASRWFRREDRV